MTEINPTNAPKPQPTPQPTSPADENKQPAEAAKTGKDVKGTGDSTETQASAEAASQTVASQQAVQSAQKLNELLNQKFGEKVGNTAFEMISAQIKDGKKLTPELIQSSIETAAKKHKQDIPSDDIKAFIKGAIPEKPKPKPEELPEPEYVDISQFIKVQNDLRRETLKFIDSLKDQEVADDIERAIIQRQEIKEQTIEKTRDLNKLRNPRDFA